MEKEKAIEVLISLAKSVKPNLRATEAEHAMIKEAIEVLQVVPPQEKPVDQAVSAV